jgi:plastocyanin
MKTVQKTLITTALIGFTGVAMQAQAYSAARGNCQPGYGPHPYYSPYGQIPPPAYRAPLMRPPMRPMPYPQRYYQQMQRPPVKQKTVMHPSAEQTPQSEKPAAAMDSAVVSISQMQFVPARVVVKKGGTVTWNQSDAMPHTVTAKDGNFASQQLGANQSFSQVFDKPGTYSYYCSLHPSMQAVVEVVE